MGATIYYGVDALTLSTHPVLSLFQFDRIIWNFPHNGIVDYPREPELFVTTHQEMFEKLFQNCRSLLTTTGTIHLTYKAKKEPYTQWDVPKQAKKQKFLLEKICRFDIEFWSKNGYKWVATQPTKAKAAAKFMSDPEIYTLVFGKAKE